VYGNGTVVCQATPTLSLPLSIVLPAILFPVDGKTGRVKPLSQVDKFILNYELNTFTLYFKVLLNTIQLTPKAKRSKITTQ
jgi:hypothetical protein